VLEWFARLMGTRLSVVDKRFAHAIRSGGIDKSTHRHDHQQCHEALGLLERPRGGAKLEVFQQSNPAFGTALLLIADEPLLW
jgi:hypothetical protein